MCFIITTTTVVYFILSLIIFKSLLRSMIFPKRLDLMMIMKQTKKPKPCITLWKKSKHLRTLDKCRKCSPEARVFNINFVFSSVHRVLSESNTQLRLLYLLNLNVFYVTSSKTFCKIDRKNSFENVRLRLVLTHSLNRCRKFNSYHLR